MRSFVIAHVASADIPVDETSATAIQAGIQKSVQAGWIMGAAVLAIALLWFCISRAPRPKKAMNLVHEIHLARWIGCVMVMTVAAVSWDTWWHRAVGRDSVWVPPHLALYAGALFCILTSLYGWYRTRNTRWKMVALAVLLIPIGAPFDQLWHTFFGVEDLTRPIALIWAPPHLMIEFASVFTFLSLLPILYGDTVRDLRNLMGTLIFGTLTGTVLYILLPLHPTEGLGEAIGFWGVLPMSAALIVVPLIGKAWLRDSGGATKIMLVTVIMFLTAYTQKTAPQIVMPPHGTMPNWLIIFTNMLTAAWLDVSDRYPMSVRGIIGGAFSAGFMFGIARFFFESQFFYGDSTVLFAILMGGIGGWIGAMIATRVIQRIL